jgi:GH15 family glucan-1,4-alpha-glucosidase
MNHSRVEQLWEASGEVLKDCALDNGAIIAANTANPLYPATAENYHYSWGRDAAYQIYAAHQMALPEAAGIKQRYEDWLLERCQGFNKTGLIIKRYHPNGPLDWRYGSEYQPDQAGALLWALHETTPDPDNKTDHVMRLLANGIVSQWDETHFKVPTQDLWENRLTNPETQEVFTYSLAACIKGLNSICLRLAAQGVSEVDSWRQAQTEMKAVLERDNGFTYSRKITVPPHHIPTDEIDASLSGLVWPFGKDAPTIKEQATVQKISSLWREGGTLRYFDDTYDGISRVGGVEQNAGAWPLLSFWFISALAQVKAASALPLYDIAITHHEALYATGQLPNNVIPEQLFADKERQGKGILPLAWSHAMFVIATKHLDLI